MNTGKRFWAAALLARLDDLGYREVWAISDAANPVRIAASHAALRGWPKCNLLARRA